MNYLVVAIMVLQVGAAVAELVYFQRPWAALVWAGCVASNFGVLHGVTR